MDFYIDRHTSSSFSIIGFFGSGSLGCSICYYDVFRNVVLEKSGSRVGQHFFGAGLDATSKMKLKEI